MKRGWTLGPCWHDCAGKVAWPPAEATADVECDSEFNRHRSRVSPAVPTATSTGAA